MVMDASARTGHTLGMNDEVFLHAGAPRTGTSSFQMFLEANREAIRAQGVDPAYPGRDGAESGALALRLPYPRHDARALRRRARNARRNLAALLSEGRPALISEENIPGRFMDIYKGQFFPTAPLRAGFMADVLRPRKVARLTLVLRPYAAMFLSGFRKRAEDQRQGPFRDIAPRMAAFEGGWPEVVAALTQALDPGELRLLTYRRRPQAQLAAEVCPLLDTAKMVEPGTDANTSLSDAALIAMQEKLHAGVDYSPALLEEMRAAYAQTKPEAPYAAFTEAETARLDARFEADLERLEAMPGVTLKRD